MIDKICYCVDDAVRDVRDGDTILSGGFGMAGAPNALLDALYRRGARNLTFVSNNIGEAGIGLRRLVDAGRVRKLICSFPRAEPESEGMRLYREGRFDIEVVPQGTLSERLRAAGAGIGGFYTPTGVGTAMADGKEVRRFEGRDYLLERPLPGDWAFVRAARADRWGNLTYSKAGRNFGPTMAMAARRTVVEVDAIVDLGALDPEAIVTPGIFVERVVRADAVLPRAA